MNEETASTTASLDDKKDAAWDVFLSYASENADWVREFEAELSTHHLKVFDPYSTPTKYWGNSRDEVLAAIYPSKCPIAFVLLSVAYTRSEHSRELELLLQSKRSHLPCLLLPVRLDDSPLPESVQSIAILDASAQTPSQIAKEVAAKVRDWQLVTAPSFSSRADQACRDDLVQKLMANAGVEAHRLRYMYPWVDAEEVVQEALIYVLENMQRRPELDLLRYFRHAVHYEAMDLMRRKRKEHQSKEFTYDLSSKEVAIDPEVERELFDQIRHALDLLDPIDREIIMSRYMNGQTLDDMAKHMAITPSTLSKRLHRALTKLRTVLQIEG